MTVLNKPLKKAASGWRCVRQVSLVGVTLAFAAAACTDDSIVYPNRNLSSGGGAATDDGGPLAAAGEAGGELGGARSSGGSGATGGGIVVGDDDAGAEAGTVGAAGTMSGGPVCGNGMVEPPEECDDGNTISGDGCSAQCKSHCETCEDKVCSDGNQFDTDSPAYDDCYKATGNIATGPANGAPRADICRALVDCIRSQDCAQKDGDLSVKFNRCWCDLDWSRTATVSAATLCASTSTFVAGKCASQFQDASEADSPADVERLLAARSTALGLAMTLLIGCDENICVEECLPEYFGDNVVATIAQDLTGAPSSSGESQLGDPIGRRATQRRRYGRRHCLCTKPCATTFRAGPLRFPQRPTAAPTPTVVCSGGRGVRDSRMATGRSKQGHLANQRRRWRDSTQSDLHRPTVVRRAQQGAHQHEASICFRAHLHSGMPPSPPHRG